MYTILPQWCTTHAIKIRELKLLLRVSMVIAKLCIRISVFVRFFWAQLAYIIQMSALKEVKAGHVSPLISDYKSCNVSFQMHSVSRGFKSNVITLPVNRYVLISFP